MCEFHLSVPVKLTLLLSCRFAMIKIKQHIKQNITQEPLMHKTFICLYIHLYRTSTVL